MGARAGAYGSVTSARVVGEPPWGEDGDEAPGEADQLLVGEVAQHLGARFAEVPTRAAISWRVSVICRRRARAPVAGSWP